MGAARTTTILPPPPADGGVLSTCWEATPVSFARGHDDFCVDDTPTCKQPGPPTDLDELAGDDYRTIAAELWS